MDYILLVDPFVCLKFQGNRQWGRIIYSYYGYLIHNNLAYPIGLIIYEFRVAGYF